MQGFYGPLMKARGLCPTTCASHTAWWRNAYLPTMTTKPCHIHPDAGICTEPKQTPRPQRGKEGGGGGGGVSRRISEKENGSTLHDAVTEQAATHKGIPLLQQLLWGCT